jgi:hypothetical protein
LYPILSSPVNSASRHDVGILPIVCSGLPRRLRELSAVSLELNDQLRGLGFVRTVAAGKKSPLRSAAVGTVNIDEGTARCVLAVGWNGFGICSSWNNCVMLRRFFRFLLHSRPSRCTL